MNYSKHYYNTDVPMHPTYNIRQTKSNDINCCEAIFIAICFWVAVVIAAIAFFSSISFVINLFK